MCSSDLIENGYKHINSQSKFDMTLSVVDYGAHIGLSLNYCKKLFNARTIERFIGYFRGIAEQVIKGADQKLSEIELITEGEKDQILYDFNNTDTEYARNKTIHELFEDQVEKVPDHTAIVYKDYELSYLELNQRVNRLARVLRKKGVKSNTIVGIMVERSPVMIIGILGILKAGGAYLPINPDEPDKRIKSILKDSHTGLLLTQYHYMLKFENVLETIDLEDANLYKGSRKNLVQKGSWKHLAYVIYTSGSTGNPKGVMVDHISVNNLVFSLNERVYKKYTGYLRVAVAAPYIFDASIKQIFGILLIGHGLYIIPENVRVDGDLFLHFLRKNKIEISDATPSHLQLLLASTSTNESELNLNLRNLLVGGEPLSKTILTDFFDAFSREGLSITNVYGPAECCVDSTSYGICREEVKYLNQIPIGKSLPNVKVYVLDTGNKLVPIGIAGELCISGDGVSRGYLNSPHVTGDKFITNPFLIGETLYKTGDLGRWLPDGNIEFLGRIDHQVKIRGYRIEPGEIERQLLKIDIVKECVVIERERNGDKYLCAYIVIASERPVESTEPSAAELRKVLSGVLPEYMIPSYFVEFDRIPLTPNGKVDRKALPDPKIEAGDEYIAPRNKAERRLAELWSEVLGIKSGAISINANFFELGGHSLKATILISRIHREFDVRIALGEMFVNPTIEGLSKVLREGFRDEYVKIEVSENKEYYPLSPAQKRLYILQQMEERNTSYNIPGVIELGEGVDREKLEEAFMRIISRHESLRTWFDMVNNEPVQKINRAVDFKIENYHLKSDVSDIDNDHSFINSGVRLVLDKFVRPFDLSKAPLLRVGIINIESSNLILLFDLHHIITDGISQRVLEREFYSLYSGEELPLLRLQYTDFAEWQNHNIRQGLLKGQEEYWVNLFSDELPVLNLPSDFSRPLVQSFEGASVSFVLNPEETKGIKAAARKNDVTLFMVMLSIFNIFLSNLSGSDQEDIIVGTPIAGRRHADLDNIIGMFVNTLALRSSPRGDKSFKEFLDEVKQRTLEAYENQEYQFEDLVDKVFMKRDAGRNPIFDVMLNVLNQDEYESRGDISFGIDIESGYRHIESQSKFDMTLSVVDYGDHIDLSLNYCTKLFNARTIERFIEYFIGIAKKVIRGADQKLSEIEFITEGEKHQILYDLNNTKTGYPRDKTIHELFDEQVGKTPDNIAIVLNNENVSYRDLNLRANQWAKFLREKGARPDTLIGIMNERSVEIITGLIAIIKSGGAYLPIDKKYPEFRIKRTLIDNKVNLILFKDTNCNFLEAICETIKLDRFDYNADSNDPDIIENLNKPSDLVYVILTSGTTGYPNGVMIEHYNVVNLAFTQRLVFNIEPSDRILQFSSLSFDASVEQIWITFLSGAGLVLVKEEVLLDKKAFEEYVIERSVTHIHAVPSYLNEMKVKNRRELKRMVSGGDICTVGLARRWSKGIDFYNEYGPTETTVTSIEKMVNEVGEDQPFISIGRPIGNTIIYILSKYMKVIPMGVVGELYIGGDGVSRGYLNNPELTRSRFLDHPIVAGCKMYKSGDLSRWLPNGDIEFLGRIDNQVKIRGFRIELGEIENQLLGIELIKEAVVIDKEIKGDKYLCAYITSDKEIKDAELREKLSNKLPDYMIPSYFIRIDQIPLTPNGKVDRRSLPEPEIKVGGSYLAPRNETDERLVAIWSEALGIDSEKISIDANFFELGGHSLKAVNIVSKIHKAFDVKVPLIEVFKTPKIRDLSEYILSCGKDRYVSIELVEKKEYFGLSSAQKRLYILQQMEVSNTSYNLPAVIELGDDVDLEKLEKSFNGIISRHESLRTSFEIVNNEPVQKINRDVDFKIENYHLKSDVMDNEFITRGISTVMEKFVRPFDLGKAPLLRVGIINSESSNSILLFDLHHIITDGTSQGVLEREFYSLYSGGELPLLRLQYKDFAEWQNHNIHQGLLKGQEEYWVNLFSDELPVLNLPSDFSRPLIQSFEGAVVSFVLNADETKGIKATARDNDVTLFMVMLSIFNVLLSKLSGSNQEDIIVGTPIAGRRHADLENIIGMFVNTLALRNSPRGDKSFKEFLDEVKQRTLEAYENQEYQFEDLVEEISVKRDAGRNPIFDVLLNVLNQDEYDSRGDISVDIDIDIESGYKHVNSQSKFDMTLSVVDYGDHIGLSLNYCKKLFNARTIERFIGYFRGIAEQVIKGADQKLSDIELITEGEKDQILYDFNNTETEFPGNKTIHELFEDQVEKVPHQIAVVYNDYALSYLALNQRANRLARVLRGKGVQSGYIVGIMVERSLEMIGGILGIVKAGGGYLPIDPKFPVKRIKYSLLDSRAGLLLTQDHLYKYDFNELDIDTMGLCVETFIEGAGENLERVCNCHHLAYVIYTSGSTGNPKGVMIEHMAVVNLLFSMQKNYPIGNSDRYLLKTSFIFDVSVTELFSWYLGGGSLAILEKDGEMDSELILDTIECIGITHINFVPSMFAVFVEALSTKNIFKLSHLRYIFLAGEELLPWLVNRFRRFNTKVVVENLYGPTEAAVYSSRFSLSDWDGMGNIFIGRSLENVKIFVLDPSNHLCPVGIPGELSICGDGLARGYLNNPDLTEKSFKWDSFRSVRSGDPFYRTGDLARFLSDGNIEFLGRIDSQIKIRGLRIELGEIESQISKIDYVEKCIVTAIEKGDERYICAYIVSKKEFDISEIRDFLSNELPEYMIPSYFVHIESIPLTPGGKVDRKSLPEPKIEAGEDYIAPRNKDERRLVELWSDLLGISSEAISINANFFELGGHSLKATILISRIHQEFNVRVTLGEMFVNPTIKGLSKVIKEGLRDEYVKMEVSEKKEYYLLSPAQKRLYILQQMQVRNTSYNLPQVIELREDIDIEKLEETYRRIISRHESLRTSFDMVNNEPVQKIYRAVDFKIEYYIIKSGTIDPENLRRKVVEVIENFTRPFDLSQAPLLRVGIVNPSLSNPVLLFDLHHIITDGTSQRVLEQEFYSLYSGGNLPVLRLQYKDFAEWQNSKEQQELIKDQEKYWLKEFSGEIPVLNLPTDFSRPLVQSFDGAAVHFVLGEQDTSGVKAIARNHEVTLFMVILSLFNILLSKLSGSNQEDIIVGTPIAARRHADLERIIGMFVNTLAIRNYPSGNKTFREFLEEVKEKTLETYENQEYQFEDLVDRISIKRDTSRNPIFDVMFNLLNQTDYSGDLSGLEEDEEYIHRPGTSKFDLNLRAVDIGERVLFEFEYNRTLFKPETFERFIYYFKKIIQSIIMHSERKISDIEIISDAQKKEILLYFNEDLTKNIEMNTIQNKLDESFYKYKDNTAIEYGSNHLSYSELENKTKSISNWIIRNKIKKGNLIGIYVDDKIEIISIIIGILKACCVFVPLDTRLPIKRIEKMIRTTNTEIIFTDRANKETLINNCCNLRDTLTILSIDDKYDDIYESLESKDRGGGEYDIEDKIYIYFTSGSTGNPKAIIGKNIGLLQFIEWEIDTFQVNSTSRVSQFAAVGFDAFLRNIFTPLCSGAVVCIPRNNALVMDRDALIKWIDRKGITLIHCVPSLFRLFNSDELTANHYNCLKYVLLSGESINPFELNNWYNKFGERVQLVNLYGPTETTVIKSFYLIQKNDVQKNKIPIGKPMKGARLIILDKNLKICPIGIVGEIYIRTPYMAFGYINDSSLYEGKYIPNPYNRAHTDIIYKTGDLGLELESGDFEFLGRIDGQIKVRGVRIEIGEIETSLLRLNGIKEAVVINRKDEQGQTYLCGYLVLDKGGKDEDSVIDTTEIRKVLSEDLPDYMIPSYFMQIEKIPLQANGKINRNALPEPKTKMNVGKDYMAPQNEMEEKLAEIWSEVLEIKKEIISVNANFFELGGHSLKATILASKIYKELNVKIPLIEIFKTPTMKELTRIIKDEEKEIRIEEDNNLVLIKKDVNRLNNLFFIHDVYGEVEMYVDFCMNLNAGFNYWGIKADKIEDFAPREINLKDIAKNYIKKIKKIQPHGPYHIAGWSRGGLIAFEMIGQLEQAGEHIRFFSIIDSASVPRKTYRKSEGKLTVKSELEFIRRYVKDERIIEKLKQLRDINSLWSMIVAYLEETNSRGQGLEELTFIRNSMKIPYIKQNTIKEIIYFTNMRRTFDNAKNIYKPGGKVNATLYYFKANESNFGPEKWKRHFRNQIRSYEVSGDHFSIFKNPDFAELFDTILKLNGNV